jgi:hypothetical protein
VRINTFTPSEAERSQRARITHSCGFYRLGPVDGPRQISLRPRHARCLPRTVTRDVIERAPQFAEVEEPQEWRHGMFREMRRQECGQLIVIMHGNGLFPHPQRLNARRYKRQMAHQQVVEQRRMDFQHRGSTVVLDDITRFSRRFTRPPPPPRPDESTMRGTPLRLGDVEVKVGTRTSTDITVQSLR